MAPGFTIAGEINAGRGAVSGMAISPDGDVLMTTHYGADSVSLIDTTKAAVTLAVVDVEESFAIAMSGNRAYVSSVSAEHDSVLAFDTKSNEIVAEYPLAFSVTDLAVSPNGRHLYAGRTDVEGADVAILDTKTGKEDAVRIAATAGTTTGCVRVSPEGRRLYVAANGSSTAHIVMVDAVQKRVLNAVEIASPIRDIALSPDGATAYVGSAGPDFGTVLDIIDTRTSTITSTHKIGDVSRACCSADGEPRRRAGIPGRRSGRDGAVHCHSGRDRQHRGRRRSVVRDREPGRQAAVHRRLRGSRHRPGDRRDGRARRPADWRTTS